MEQRATTTIIVNFHAKPERVRDLRALLADAIPRLSELPGCRGGSLHHDVDEPELFVLIEHWDTADQHRAYLDRIEQDGTMKRLMPLLARPPERRYLSNPVATG